ncbi:MAG: hypothetical protein ACYC0X_25915 [Pirellulaceae bacterium]
MNLTLMCLLSSGCAAIPEITHEPQVHNPFPQLHRVAILPFYNLSADPTVNQDDVALAYYNELQQIPGFEVMPPGVVKQWLMASRIEIDGSTDFQLLARKLGVDAVIRGAVTEFTPYYPPRMGIAVDWFAANPSFHPIPPGYGLPWGTSQEEHIPDTLVFEAEFALAREQLKTQTPPVPEDVPADFQISGVRPAQHAAAELLPHPEAVLAGPGEAPPLPDSPGLPPDWPDPRGFVPPPPAAVRPACRPQYEPVMTHTRVYTGDDARLTDRLEAYFNFRDDARDGGWQGYLLRSHDFIRFCCYLHITETLTARGGAGKSRVVWRWPIGRYDVGTGRR